MSLSLTHARAWGSAGLCHQALSDLTLEPGTSEGEAQAMTRRAVILAEAALQQDASDARTHLAIAINLARLAVYSDNKTKVSLVRQVRTARLSVDRLVYERDVRGIIHHCVPSAFLVLKRGVGRA